MDPISQATFGASWALSAQKKDSKRPRIRRALMFGCVTGMAADLDVLIRSQTDSLLSLEFHRQFTHSLIFTPVGALICCFFLNRLFRFYKKFPQRESFKQDYFVCFMAYLSHGLLDAATSYGTQLYWPFTNYRESFDIISIIDPIFTSMLILGLVLTAVKSNVIYTRVFLAACFAYFGLGFVQQHRAKASIHELAKERGHIPERLTVKPSLGNLLLWKSVYTYEGTYYVDAIRAGVNKKVYEGQTTKNYSLEDAQALVKDAPIQMNDVKRFYWFSQGYISVDKDNPNYIIDVRYSMIPNEVKALWGVIISPGQDKHVNFVHTRGRSKEVGQKFGRMLRGE
ncbi:MAG: metal-dependent hydrolase [Oligoflexia bacterium]|nr:metal-dependent hydrolase [Oligoflexia bacterium]